MPDPLGCDSWIPGPSFVCYGARFHLRAWADEAFHDIERRLPTPRRTTVARADCVYSITEDANGFGLIRNEERLLTNRSLRTVHSVLESDIHTCVARAARRKLFVHAGAVGWRGHAIVIPARTLSGKSSLVAALVEAGADYYSDEYAVIDPLGRIHPYPKPISLRRPNGKRPRKRTAADLGGRDGIRPIPLGIIVVTKYADGAPWNPMAMSTADGMMHLFANTVLAQVRPRFALSALMRAVAGCRAVESERPEAGAIVPSILQMMDEMLDGRR